MFFEIFSTIVFEYLIILYNRIYIFFLYETMFYFWISVTTFSFKMGSVDRSHLVDVFMNYFEY